MTISDLDLTGRVALVTGAGRGLGRAVALRLAAAGAAVAVNDLDPAGAAATADAVTVAGGTAIALPGDAARADSVAALLGTLDRRFGRLDILVNNAGITRAQEIFDTDEADWDEVVRVNLTGPFLVAKAAMVRMRDAGRGGRIVNMGSMVGHQGAVRGWVHYGATKAGLHGLTKTLARTAAKHAITVNAVAPGIIASDMLIAGHGADGVAQLVQTVPLGRLGTPEDVAAAVHFLSSDAARYITGAVIDVNGGMYMR
jgi:3-oxoacyl-[acyl-carrier protein] reductase